MDLRVSRYYSTMRWRFLIKRVGRKEGRKKRKRKKNTPNILTKAKQA